VLDITSIGFYLLPVSVVLVIVIAWSGGGPIFPDSLGVMQGIAASLIWGAYISHGVPRCRPGVPVTVVVSGVPGDVVTSGCVNIDSHTWLMRGVATGITGLLAYLIARTFALRRSRGEP
jgi:hypothetical protein